LKLEHLFEDASLTKRPISLNKAYYQKYLKFKGVTLQFKDDTTFYVPLYGSTFDKKGRPIVMGKVRLQVDILPKDQAALNKVGEARSDPNCNPYLPPPVGRISFSMNPLKMFTQLVGPRLRRKIYLFCCLAVCCMMCLAMLPMMIS